MDPTRKLAIGVLAVLTGLLVAVAAASLGWRIKHDAALMLYFAYLIDSLGWMPYRDFFEHQPPGAHWTFLAVGKVFGYGDRGLGEPVHLMRPLTFKVAMHPDGECEQESRRSRRRRSSPGS